MPQMRGMVEIRLDRRQAFYVFVGAMLIVSVAFVVGLIVGQRMQVDAGTMASMSQAEPAHEAIPEEAPVEADRQRDDFTFYDSLGRGGRPDVAAIPDNDPIGDPAGVMRALPRQPVEATPEEPVEEPARERERVETAEPDDNEPVQVEPAEPEPVSAAPEALAMAVPEEPPVQRRTVRRVSTSGSSQGAVPEDFGFFTVVAGQFANFDAASEIRNELRDAGHDAIITIVGESGDRFRVQVGSYTRRGEASSTESALQSLGVSARVLQEG